MTSIADIVHMGGYAKFVWTAYALCTLGLAGVLWLSVRAWKTNEREFGALKARDDRSGS